MKFNFLDNILGLFCCLGIIYVLTTITGTIIKIISLNASYQQCQQTLELIQSK